ncbi:hypothetical protein BFC17_08770 [Alteromonas lipolytica]|uniref:HTH tetR-type domain-containing protein n=1 Tax=Alteromonas lipolytica TaxID=1856405 RepID=A0A1E8FKL1_9ALTE|nr:hypothetical protein BFC17_08770 [Alteromonas lipolytica]
MAKNGITAVRVEPLAKKLNVTKGSFYWHYKGRGDLLAQIIQRWRNRSTSAIIERLSGASLSPKERLKELFLLPAKRNQKAGAAALEQAIRNWAQHDKSVKEVIDEVDSHRLAFIAGNFKALGNDDDEAELKAMRFYCAMQGIAVLGKPQDSQKINRIFDSLF